LGIGVWKVWKRGGIKWGRRDTHSWGVLGKKKKGANSHSGTKLGNDNPYRVEKTVHLQLKRRRGKGRKRKDAGGATAPELSRLDSVGGR